MWPAIFGQLVPSRSAFAWYIRTSRQGNTEMYTLPQTLLQPIDRLPPVYQAHDSRLYLDNEMSISKISPVNLRKVYANDLRLAQILFDKSHHTLHVLLFIAISSIIKLISCRVHKCCFPFPFTLRIGRLCRR